MQANEKEDLSSGGGSSRSDDIDTSLFFDPYQIFEVSADKCHIARIQVLNGQDKPKGWVFSLFHTPDLYIMLHVPNTPNGYKRTKTIVNCLNPVWNETFTFLLDPHLPNELEIFLMDANSLRNDTMVDEVRVDLNDLTLGEEADKEINFPKGSTAWIKLLRVEDSQPDLRFSLTLSPEEKEFLNKRREKILEAMRLFLGSDYGPNEVKEVPCIGLLGSGGGFRALVGLSGAVKALHESGAFDCLTYIASLSGGSWYISYLYAQEELQTKGPTAYQEQLRQIICQNNWLKLLTPIGVFRYLTAILRKSKAGQPVSLTDFFGHLVGDSVLGTEMKYKKLSEQASKLEKGEMPLPLYTCINVKKNVSARVYQEWIEFSPYEVGFARYGAFMKPGHFGCKFFMGKLVRQFEEPPIHYLQGLWGSAYCILFRRIVKERWKKDYPRMRLSIEEDEYDLEEQNEEVVSNDELWDCAGLLADNEELSPTTSTSDCAAPDVASSELFDTAGYESSFVRLLEKEHQSIEARLSTAECQSLEGSSRKSQNEFHDSAPSTSQDETTPQVSTYATNQSVTEHTATMHKCIPFTSVGAKRIITPDQIVLEEPFEETESEASYWQTKLESILYSGIMNNRAGRAGLIFNPLRGLNISETYPISPFTPTTPDDEDDFKGNFEPAEMNAKQLFLVDAGLTFNLPFPLLMRPQRAVDIYLSYDFSTRSADNVSPFREILHVEKWALLNKIPFPPIHEQVRDYLQEPLRECYVFESTKDPYCPVIIHFILLNDKFRVYKAPGVRRKTDEEKQFASFNIFSDPKDPFSLYNFAYTQEQFDRLSALMEFNTLINLPVIRAQMARVVARKRLLPLKPPIKLDKIAKMRIKSTARSLERLQEYVKTMSEMQVQRENLLTTEEVVKDETQVHDLNYDKIQEYYAHKENTKRHSADASQTLKMQTHET